ncbi:MAG: OadG family protein [Bacteroidales bacterium]|jgi:Na+-transporting methylmalonyl-CoA/oxaloacetate decarboxylase gamma subunit|nr:OadG family protein [Bacteroidales bacterium]
MNIEIINKAIEISGIGMLTVFFFMAVFYFVIVGIDKLFPYKEEEKKK